MSDLLPLDFGGPTDHPFRPMSYADLERPVFEMFREVADRWRNRPAVTCDLGTTTYCTLADLACAIASEVGSTTADAGPVGIALPVDYRFPAAMLGSLGAGRAYVPLDLSQPEERLRHIVEHAGLTTVVACTETFTSVSALVPDTCRIVNIDDLPPAPASWQPQGSSSDAAYVLYTSGSTGRPKGVWQNQRSLLHDVMQYTNSIHFSELDVTSLLYSPGVNGAIRDIYGALLNGGCLCMVDLRRDGYTTAAERLGAAGITIFHAMPPVLRSLLREVPPDAAAAMTAQVRLAYVAGDRFWGSDARLLRDALPHDAVLYTGIGSTECATLYRQWCVPADWPLDDGLLPVGYAIPDRDMVLVDDEGRAVEPGEPGLITVRSRHIARGYWRDDALTAEVFVPDPHDAEVVTFHSGDRGQLTADGLLTFLGRADRQVKIRGYRVELGEVESALRATSGVTDASVVCAGSAESPRLVAFVEVPATGIDLIPDVQATATNRLPSHMRPAHFVQLTALPRLGNGKLDVQRLMGLASTVTIAREELSPDLSPRGELLQRVMNEWRRVLGHRVRSADTNWERAGGDSLQALEVTVALEQALGVRLPADLMTPASTPTTVTARLRVLLAQPEGTTPEVDSNFGSVFIIPWAPGVSIHEHALAAALETEFRVEVLSLPSLQEELVHIHSIPELASRCAELIEATTRPNTPVCLLGLSFGGRVAVDLAAQLKERGYHVPLLGIGDIASDFGYETLSRHAWQEWALSSTATTPLRRLYRRCQADLRMRVGAHIRQVAAAGHVRRLRATTRIGLAIFGESFRGGTLSAIRQSQVPAWQIPYRDGELVLFVTASTAEMFAETGPTLGWDRHAQSVRVVPLEGHHSDYFDGQLGAGFAAAVLAEARRAVGITT